MAETVKVSFFWDDTVCGLTEFYRRSKRTLLLPYLCVLNIEIAGPSETSVNFHGTP